MEITLAEWKEIMEVPINRNDGILSKTLRRKNLPIAFTVKFEYAHKEHTYSKAIFIPFLMTS